MSQHSRTKKNVILLLMLFTAAVIAVYAQGNQGSSTKTVNEISGTLEDGLRIIDVDPTVKKPSFAVYRGDYVVFAFREGGTHTVAIPDLNIDTEFPRPKDESRYVKFKEIGDFSLQIDERTGSITVLQFETSKYEELSASEAAAVIENTGLFILDVRTQPEFDEGHIKDAKLIPVQSLAERLEELSVYKDEEILIYCRSGNRSTVASQILIDAGFTRVKNMRHGIIDWSSEGLPVITE